MCQKCKVNEVFKRGKRFLVSFFRLNANARAILRWCMFSWRCWIMKFSDNLAKYLCRKKMQNNFSAWEAAKKEVVEVGPISIFTSIESGREREKHSLAEFTEQQRTYHRIHALIPSIPMILYKLLGEYHWIYIYAPFLN